MCGRHCGCGGTSPNCCAAVGQHPERTGAPSPPVRGNCPALPHCSWDSTRKLFPHKITTTQKISNYTRSACPPAFAPAQAVASPRPLPMGREWIDNHLDIAIVIAEDSGERALTLPAWDLVP